MIDFDTSQYPAGALGWHGLLEAIDSASPGDESEWIEFKANLDPRQKVDRPALAKAIVAFANRDVARAAQHFEGRGLIVIGLEPGNLVGAPEIDPAKLHDAVQPYLADPAPQWDVQYLTYKDKRVLVVTVNAPQMGDPIHCIAKDGDKVHDGDVYVRNVGKSAPAKSADLRMLSVRLLTQIGQGLEVEVIADASDGVPLFEYPDDWVDRWVNAERGRLLAPLAPPPPEPPADFRLRGSSLGALGLSESLREQGSAATRLADLAASVSNPFEIKHEEERTEASYKAEVEEYLIECRQRLPRAIKTLRVALTSAVLFRVRNLTDANFQRLEVHVHVEGDVTAFDGRAEFRGLSTHIPQAPRIWGPWTESRVPAINRLDYRHMIGSTPTVPYVAPMGPRIVNGGSADITFVPVDLRPHATEDLDDGILLLGGASLDSDITCAWSATATNMNGRAEGNFVIPLRTQRIDLSEYLKHGSTERTWNRDDHESNIVFPDDWDDEPDV